MSTPRTAHTGTTRPPGDERGATLALMALLLTALVALAALVVDVGAGWSTRRGLAPASDAAALAAAQTLAERPWDTAAACGLAGTYLRGNAPDAILTGCEVSLVPPAAGRVSVTVAEDADAWFSGGDGADQAPIAAASSAAWGYPLAVTGLRPVGLCRDATDALRQVFDHPTASTVNVVIPFVRTNTAACGGPGVIGNFVSLDFEGGSSIQRIRQWATGGYPGPILPDDTSYVDCSGGATCYERPWVLPDLQYQLKDLRDRRTWVLFPVYDHADAERAHVIGAVRVRIRDLYLGSYTDSWYLSLDIRPGLVGGTCCSAVDRFGGSTTFALCGVDAGAFEACEPEGAP